MKEFIDKLISELKQESIIVDDDAGHRAVEIIEELAEEYNNGWISVLERLPEAEEKVLVLAKRKYRDGSFKYIITTAMYEDGTVLENDSKWRWEDLDAEWDEEEDCYIIPEGWWEDKAYNPDGVLNYAIDDEVIAWQPLPQAYQEEGGKNE